MNFNDQKVRQAVVAHLRFALEAVKSISNEEHVDNIDLALLDKAMENVLVVAILNFTLAQDYRLKNTLVELRPENIKDPNMKIEDLIL